MSYASTEYVIPASPPDELLAELDAAAGVLDELSSRAVELTLGMDDRSGRLRIELVDEGESRRLSPRELFALLAAEDV